MPIPRTSQALSRFTVLDLTRVRSGPTCVRQLADWGANVIKIDTLMEGAGGEQEGAARPPEFGEQTDEVLAEFGFTADEIGTLKQDKVV
jgi:crotonobetainyl-CoA:carnitine CoA-transferase CaiB-like acyl-CoA transferase